MRHAMQNSGEHIPSEMIRPRRVQEQRSTDGARISTGALRARRCCAAPSRQISRFMSHPRRGTLGRHRGTKGEGGGGRMTRPCPRPDWINRSLRPPQTYLGNFCSKYGPRCSWLAFFLFPPLPRLSCTPKRHQNPHPHLSFHPSKERVHHGQVHSREPTPLLHARGQEPPPPRAGIEGLDGGEQEVVGGLPSRDVEEARGAERAGAVLCVV